MTFTGITSEAQSASAIQPLGRCSPSLPTTVSETQKEMGSRSKTKTKWNTWTTQKGIAVTVQFESCRWTCGCWQSCWAQAFWWKSALTSHLPPFISQLPSLLEMAPAEPRGRARGERCHPHPASNGRLSSCILPAPPCPPENGEMFREVLQLGQLRHSQHTSVTTGSLAATLAGKDLQSSLTGQHFICFAIRLRPALQLQSLITSEQCQQFNPNPVRFTILLLYWFLPQPPFQAAKGKKATLKPWMWNLTFLPRDRAHLSMTEEMWGCSSQLDSQPCFPAPENRPLHHV